MVECKIYFTPCILVNSFYPYFSNIRFAPWFHSHLATFSISRFAGLLYNFLISCSNWLSQKFKLLRNNKFNYLTIILTLCVSNCVVEKYKTKWPTLSVVNVVSCIKSSVLYRRIVSAHESYGTVCVSYESYHIVNDRKHLRDGIVFKGSSREPASKGRKWKIERFRD